MSQRLAPMIRWMTRHPLATAMLAGLVARVVAAWVGVGFHARDDYFHVLEPALRWTADPGFDWDKTDLPGAGIRSHLVPRAVWLLVLAARHLGVHEPTSLLRAIYLVVGLYSLLVIPGMYLLAQRLLSHRGALLATGLCAVHFAMPYAGTRLLIEAMAMPPLVWGLYLCSFASGRRVLAGGFLVGLACWFRFQVGTAAVGLALAIFWRARRAGQWRRGFTEVGALAVGGALAITLQGIFDLWTTGHFLGPEVKNFLWNLEPPPGLSRSTPLAYVGTLLLLTAPPATVVVLPPLWRAGVRHFLVSWPLLLFLLVHSIVPHKEERFLLPILPLFLLLLAAVPEEIAAAKGRLGAFLRRWWPRTAVFLLAIHLVFLVLATTSQSQKNLRQAMLTLRHDPHARALVSMGPELQLFFLGQDRDPIPNRRSSKVDIGFLTRSIESLERQGTRPNRFLGFAPEQAQVEILLRASGFYCEPPLRLDGWWMDRLIYTLNPRRNRRRSPVLLWQCEQPALARRSSDAGPLPAAPPPTTLRAHR